MWLIWVFFVVGIGGFNVLGDPCPTNLMPCGDGYCIKKQQWCDGIKQCRDGSDEMYCGKNGGKFCREDYFECTDGMCIPLSSRCDNYDDCPDGSDESDCEEDYFFPNESAAILKDGTINSVEIAVNKAAEWIWKQQQSNTADSNSNICRSIVALKLADGVYDLSSNQEETLTKKLEIFLNLQFVNKRVVANFRLGQLATYVNALRAACLNPRQFLGHDLVQKLRQKTDSAIKANEFNQPFALLTLCLVDQVSDGDFDKVDEIYISNRNLGIKALCLTAMACIVERRRYSNHYWRNFKTEMNQFVDELNQFEGQFDTYTKSLILQALNSGIDQYEDKHGIKEDMKNAILKDQLDNGSFGDALSTYLALPALLDKSLLSLKRVSCSRFQTKDPSMNGGENVLKLSIWLGNEEADSHTLSINFDNNSTLYDVMQRAATKNPLYRFEFDEGGDGKVIYSIAGLPNDVERELFWTLYETQSNRSVRVNTSFNLREVKIGVDKVHPKDKSQFIFWLKQVQ